MQNVIRTAMSPPGLPSAAGPLRDAIARIEARVDGCAGFAGDRPVRRAPVALGRDLALDAVLRGGLGRGALHEILAAEPGDAGAASGFALALAARFAAEAKTPVVWILEDAAGSESGVPYAPGLSEHGMSPERLVVVRTADGPDSLWAMEEALKCRAVGAVVADLWRTRSYDLTASRRLALAAARHGTTGLLVPAGAAGGAQAFSSAARTRFVVRAASGAPVPSAGGRVPMPGRAAWSVRVARLKAGIGHDRDKSWPLAWNHREACFIQEVPSRDALPVPVPSHAPDRPHPQALGGRDRRSA